MQKYYRISTYIWAWFELLRRLAIKILKQQLNCHTVVTVDWINAWSKLLVLSYRGEGAEWWDAVKQNVCGCGGSCGSAQKLMPLKSMNHIQCSNNLAFTHIWWYSSPPSPGPRPGQGDPVWPRRMENIEPALWSWATADILQRVGTGALVPPTAH